MEQNGLGLVRTENIWPESLPEFSAASRTWNPLFRSKLTSVKPKLTRKVIKLNKMMNGMQGVISNLTLFEDTEEYRQSSSFASELLGLKVFPPSFE
ncbi:hypothetical protein ACFX1Z_015249 [Malus domestica]